MLSWEAFLLPVAATWAPRLEILEIIQVCHILAKEATG